MDSITLIDLGIWVVYFTLIFLFLLFYRNTKTELHYRFFLKGFIVKIVGGVAFALVHIYYFKFGDTFLYHRGAVILSEALMDSSYDYLRLLASSNADLPLDLYEYSSSIAYSRGAEEWLLVKMLSPLSFISFGSYLVTPYSCLLFHFLVPGSCFKCLEIYYLANQTLVLLRLF